MEQLSNQIIASDDGGNVNIVTDVHRYVGDKRYEMSNHLGNVLEVVTDRKLAEPEEVAHLCLASASNEYAATSVTVNYLLGTDMTMEAWVKTTTATGTMIVASQYYTTGVNKGGLLIVVNGKAQFDGRNGSSTYYTSGGGTTMIADDQWHHLVGTCNNGVWKIYVDGVCESTSSTSVTGTFSGLNRTFNIGRSEFGSYFNGCIKEVSYWNYDKLADEILDDYQNYNGYSSSETGLVGYWKLNDGTGATTGDDFTPNSKNVTLYNTPTWDSEDHVAYHLPDVQQYSDYYPFGMALPGRNGAVEDYRYGFQGQEGDDEIKGEGNSVNYKYRMHDPRIGRFFAVDPLAQQYPHYSPYSFSGNKVIHAIELEGLEEDALNGALSNINKIINTLFSLGGVEDQLGTQQDNYVNDVNDVVSTVDAALEAIPEVEVFARMEMIVQITVGAQGELKFGKVGNAVDAGSVVLGEVTFTYDFINDVADISGYNIFDESLETYDPVFNTQLSLAFESGIVNVGTGLSATWETVDGKLDGPIIDEIASGGLYMSSVTSETGVSVGPFGAIVSASAEFNSDQSVKAVTVQAEGTMSVSGAAVVGGEASISYVAGVTVSF